MLCERCKKRPAMIYIQSNEPGQTKSKGYCLTCAKELGIKPVDDMMKQMGVKDAFNPDLADFTGLMDVPTFISAITQDSKIVVDENGIEAAAVTVIQMATNGFISDPPQPIDFFLDEAFTFYIYHESYLEDDTVARELLFYGEYNQ